MREENEIDLPTTRLQSMASAFSFIVEKLNALEHQAYAAYAGDEFDEDWGCRGDLLHCADFQVFSPAEYHPDFEDREPVWVAYHVMSESISGSFCHRSDFGVVPASNAPFDLVLNLTDNLSDLCQTEDEYRAASKCNAKWNQDLKASIEAAERRHQKREDG